MDQYHVIDDRMHNPKGLEVNAVLHCNLRCRSCSHLSPVMPPWFAEPEQVGRDLTRLARSYRSANVKILGGEPLLHPGLTDLIREVRESAVTDKIILATNGLLLSSADDRLWAMVDRIELSLYPAGPSPMGNCAASAAGPSVTAPISR